VFEYEEHIIILLSFYHVISHLQVTVSGSQSRFVSGNPHYVSGLAILNSE